MVRTFCWQTSKIIKWLVLRLIGGYQYFISPFLPPSCKFSVSCSNYAALAITKYGLLKGSGLAVKRLLRCQNIWISKH